MSFKRQYFLYSSYLTVTVLLFFQLNVTCLYGSQFPEYKIEYISIEHGLSQNAVRSILQDSKGFIWFATEDGLNRYDGSRLKVYRHNQLDSNSLSDNFIWDILEDNDGELWIGTNSGGLNKFDRRKERFIQYNSNPSNGGTLSNNNIRSIYEDEQGILWIGTEGGGLNKFDAKTNTFTRILNGPPSNNIFTITKDKQNRLWIGTDVGLYNYDISTNRFSYFLNLPSRINNSQNIINSIYKDKSGVLWLGTEAGLFLFNSKTKSFSKYKNDAAAANKIINASINSIIEDKEGKIWIGSEIGLCILLKDSKDSFVFRYKSPEINSLSNNHISSIIQDNTGILWVGTTEGGVNKIIKRADKFEHYNHDPFNKNSLSYSTIRSIYQDKDGILWIGTLEGGLNRFDRERNLYSHYKYSANDPSSISENTISSIFRTDKGELWIGTWGGGLEKAEFNTTNSEIVGFKHFKNDPADNKSISSNIIQVIYEDNLKRLWVGTGLGLDLFDRKNNRFIHFKYEPGNPNSISDNRIQSNCIYEDRNGNLWVGTWNGLNKLKLPSTSEIISASQVKIEHYYSEPDNPNSLSNSRIISILEGIDGIIWIGTYGGGLNKLTFNRKNTPGILFEKFTEKDGLANDIIYGILEDANGNLWLSTNNGLSKFNPSNKTFQNYYKGEGLQSNQFYWGASFKGLNGELFFGGINGFNSFYPSNLKYNSHIPPVYITDFLVFNKSVSVSEENSLLSSSIEFTRLITLPYNKDVITFEFVALDYFNPRENKYSYIMEGFDKEWVFSDKRNFATYTNLDPGEYTFKVIGSNNDGIWNKNGIDIKLIIKPPFWKTWWFILLGILATGGTVFFFIQMHIKDLLAVERVRIKLAADLHDNIGSSLTEISILSEIISKKLDSSDKEIAKNLKLITDNSRELIDKMSDIVWLVNPKRDSLYDLIIRLEDTYSEILSCTNISFRSHNLQALEKISLSMEHRQNLYLIFKEAINNAVTHSSCTEIFLNANVRGKYLEMVLKDNGNGFNTNGKNKGNGLDNMQIRAKNIGGQLEITSLPAEGTTVNFVGLIS